MGNFQLKLGVRNQECVYNCSMGKRFGDVSKSYRIADPSESGLHLSPTVLCVVEN